MGDLVEAGRPGVAIWRNEWLPPSETFIRDQILHHKQYRPVLVGYTRLAGGMDLVPDFAPFGHSRASRLLRRTIGLGPYRRQLLQLLKQQKVEVLHAHFGHGAIASAGVADALGVPMVVTLHGYDVTRAAQASPRYVHQLVRALQRADVILAVSEYIRTRALRLGAPGDRIRVEYLGIPIDEPSPATPPADARAGVAFVGRLVDKKGLRDLLLAMSSLPEPLRRYPLNIVGDGPLRAELQRLAEKNELNAHFLGHRSSNDVAALLAYSAIACVPSRVAADGDTEGLPITLLEAARGGATIVATDHAGIPEFVRDNETGLLVSEGDVAGIREALARLIQDAAKRQRLSDAARLRVVECHNVRRHVDRLEDLYSQLAARDK